MNEEPDQHRDPSSVPTRPSPQLALPKTALKDTPKNWAAVTPYILPSGRSSANFKHQFFNDSFPRWIEKQKRARKTLINLTPLKTPLGSQTHTVPLPTENLHQDILPHPDSSGKNGQTFFYNCGITLTCLTLSTMISPSLVIRSGCLRQGSLSDHVQTHSRKTITVTFLYLKTNFKNTNTPLRKIHYPNFYYLIQPQNKSGPGARRNN